MLSQAWRTCAATAGSPPGSPRNAGPKSITGIVRVTSATSFTAIALKMFIVPSWPGTCTIPPSSRGAADADEHLHEERRGHQPEPQHDPAHVSQRRTADQR